jgi:hypothetical protein
LLKLGIDIGEISVSKYVVHRHQPPSQTWRTFLDKREIEEQQKPGVQSLTY